MRGLLLAVFLVPLAAGCGTEPNSLDGSDGAPNDEGSSRIEMSVGGGAPEMKYSIWGAMDYAHHRGEFSMSDPKDRSGEGAHLLFIGRDAYFGMKILGKVRWQKESNYESSGTDRFLPGPDGVSPDQVLGLLKKLSRNVEEVGDEKVRGVSTNHYRAHLDTKKLGEEEALLPDELVVDAWIDDNGLARRLRVPFGAKDEPVSVMEMFDFGVDVNVQAPPADTIVSEDEFAQLAEQECKREHRERGESQICAIFAGSGSSSESSETMPRRVTDEK